MCLPVRVSRQVVLDAAGDKTINAARQDAGRCDLEIAEREVSGDLAFWTGVEHATVLFDGAETPLGMKLRVTEIFRFENGDFRLIHRYQPFSLKLLDS